MSAPARRTFATDPAARPALERPARWLALPCGAAAVAGFSAWNLGWLPLVCLAALVFAWLRAPGPRSAALAGFLFGAGFFGAGVSWIYVSLHVFGLMPAPLAALATALFCAYLALFPALVGSLQARLDLAPGIRALVLVPALWVLAEWMRGGLLTGFPWLALGYSQADTPLAGFAPLAGVYGVSLAAALAAGALALAAHLARARARAAAFAVALGVGLAGWLLQRIDWTEPRGEPLGVALVQGNIAQDLKFEPSRYQATLDTYRRLVESTRAKLVVLPETAIPRMLDQVDPAYLDALRVLMRARGGDLLLGAPFRDGAGRYYNGIVTIGASPLQFYAKSHLVPLGEFVPAEFRWIVSWLRIPLSDFSRGGAQAPVEAAGEPIALSVCYEDAFGEELARQLPRASVLANLSNVAWFGDSLAPGQHLQISRMRSIETGRAMIRATNTGVTAIIDARGRMLARLPGFTEGVLAGSVQPRQGATPYVRTGNAPVLVLCALALAAALAAALGGRKGAFSV
ncbi:MAG: apolipoprotein N-acyltransferase [Burkholderiales bacterium]|nr:apolipoprotein N-acyltransferase [Burkholderiales bacterium]